MPVKIMTIVGTRPEIIKLCRIIDELDKYTDHILVHSGQNYDFELNQVFFEQLKVRKPNYFLNAAGETAPQTIGNTIIRSDEIMTKEKPDALLILGDTNSCLAAISAKRRKIPIFHLEAGNRCFDQRVPEEINRKIVDHISDINMTYTEHARRYLIAEGIKPETIIKIGSPMREVLSHYMTKILKSSALKDLSLKQGEYFLVSAHREENIDDEPNLVNLLNSLKVIAEKYNKTVVFPAHPRTRKKLESMEKSNLGPRIKYMKPLGFLDYIYLQLNAFCVISDSGTITEEASILGFPAVTIRNAHERPEGMDEGTLIMCGLKAERVIEAIDITIAQKLQGNNKMKIVDDYDTENVSKKVLRVIMSYIDYVNRTVWYKY